MSVLDVNTLETTKRVEANQVIEQAISDFSWMNSFSAQFVQQPYCDRLSRKLNVGDVVAYLHVESGKTYWTPAIISHFIGKNGMAVDVLYKRDWGGDTVTRHHMVGVASIILLKSGAVPEEVINEYTKG